MKYQCIRQCYAYGKRWKMGEVTESPVPLNRHFVAMHGEPTIPIPLTEPSPVPQQLKSPHDPMRATSGLSGVASFSQMQGKGPVIRHGMGAGLKDETPMTSMKELKKPELAGQQN